MGAEAFLSEQIIGLSESIDDRVAALLVAGTGITLTYNDIAGTLTIAASSSFDGSFAALTGKPTTLSGYGITDAQPLDSDLTAIAALTTTSFGRSLLTQADAAATRTTIGAGTGTIGGSTGATDNRIVRADGTGGATVQNSAVTLDDSGNITGLGTVSSGAVTSSGNITGSIIGANSGSYFRLLRSSSAGARFACLTDYTFQIFRDDGAQNGFFMNLSDPPNSFWRIGAGTALAWGDTGVASGSPHSTGATGLSLFADANHQLGIRNGANAQRINLYGTYTDGSNFRRLFFSSTTAGAFTIGVGGSGTGASGNTLTIGNSVSVSGNGTFTGLVSVGTYTVATLPSAAANAGAMAQVTDSSVTANGSAVAGGGANRVVVFSNGSAWDVVVA